MRKLTISTLAVAVAICATGCVIAIGTGRHARHSNEDVHYVEIEGATYVVDLHDGTVHPADKETVVDVETTED